MTSLRHNQNTNVSGITKCIAVYLSKRCLVIKHFIYLSIMNMTLQSKVRKSLTFPAVFQKHGPPL